MFSTTRLIAVALAATVSLMGAATAQMAHPQQPYADLEARPVKALSEQQIADLRVGRGMSLALPAELNGYPGPSHTLDNADALGLSADQRERAKSLFASMKADAVPLGERLIQQETELDRLFSSKTIAPESLERATRAIGTTQGELRAAHLRYHLAMRDVLSPAQVKRYAELCGYVAPQSADGHGHGARPR